MYDIEIKNLCVYYDTVCALKDVNLNIENKQFLGIIGPNGGGKTTLLKVLLGLVKPNSGTIIINPKLSIGYVPQFTTFDKLFPITVFEVILMGKIPTSFSFLHRYSSNDVKDAENIMNKLGIYELKDRQIGSLSGGQMQKVLITRALINNPGILILDEPTSSIDANTKIEIYEILKELNKNITVLIVSHDIDQVILYADSLICLNKTAHSHINHKKVNIEAYNKKYNCPIELYLNNECTNKGCNCTGGIISD